MSEAEVLYDGGDLASVHSRTSHSSRQSGRSSVMSGSAAARSQMSGSTVNASNISPKYIDYAKHPDGKDGGFAAEDSNNADDNGTDNNDENKNGTSSSSSTSKSKSLTKNLDSPHKAAKEGHVSQKDITVCVQTLDREKDDIERVMEILKEELKPMLISYTNQIQQKIQLNGWDELPTTSTTTSAGSTDGDGNKKKKKDPPIVDKNLGPVVVELLRHNGSNAVLVEECAGILYLLSILNPNFKKAVARLFQAMNNHPNNQAILEDSALAIQNVVNANPDSHIRIAPSLPVLWNSMARYPDNAMLVGAALNILEDLAFNPEMLNERCMTESIPAVLKILENNSSADIKTRIQACRILAELSYESPPNQQTIGFNLSYLLACCKESGSGGLPTSSDHASLQPRGQNSEEQSEKEILQATAMEVLANVAGHLPSHKNYVNRRAIPQIIKLLTSNNTVTSADCRVQACRAIANLTIPQLEQVASLRRTAGPTVIESGGIPAVLTAMRQNIENVPLQTQACLVIQNLCLTAQKTNADEIMGEIIGAGGIPTVVAALRQHSIREELQIQGNGALYCMCYDKETIQQMTGCTKDTVNFDMDDAGLGLEAGMSGMGITPAITTSEEEDEYGVKMTANTNGGNTSPTNGTGGGISAIVRGMAFHSSTSLVQLAGLKVLSRLSLQEDFELLLSEGGLDVLLTTLHNFCDDPEICTWVCEILKNFTRPVSSQARDLQRAVASKEGIPIMLTAMRKHLGDSKFQDSAMACMRNLVLHPANRALVDEGGISTILVTMTVNSTHAAIQAYGCDALGRLAMDCSEKIRYTIDVERGMQVALQAMKDHPAHPGVQDRVVFFLVNMTTESSASTFADETKSATSASDVEMVNELAVESLQQLKPLPFLKESRQRMPPKGQERLEVLISRLEKSSSGSEKGGSGGGGGTGSKIMGLFGRGKNNA